MIRPDLLRYIDTLDEDARKLFLLADNMHKCIEDTSSEEFQIWASVLDVFDERAKQWLENRA
jgi:hypothetical protein